MKLECIAGRGGRHDRFPAGCTGIARAARECCTAEVAGADCRACVRAGAVPLPVQWVEPHWQVAGPSVQAIRDRTGPHSWLVVTFAAMSWVDPFFPVIACTSRAKAIELALWRAWQIDPKAKPRASRDGETWHCGRVTVMVYEPKP